MTQEIYVENLKKILLAKNRISRELSVKITIKGREVFIDGSGDSEYLALKVIEAIDLGFSIENALKLKDEEIIMNIINIKDLSKRNTHDVKSRIIGREGRTIRNLSELSDCAIALNDNQVGIIGDSSCINEAIIAVESLIKGSKQANVYARLERDKKKRRLSLETPIKYIRKIK